MLVLAFGVSGCGARGPKLYPVSGSVRFQDGAPVRNASIEFLPMAPGRSARGRIDANGRFVLSTYAANDGAPAGEYRVVVVQVLPPGASESMKKLGPEHAGHAGEIQVVAMKHASPNTTEVTASVSADSPNDLEVVVQAR